jgi:hypothetical protein
LRPAASSSSRFTSFQYQNIGVNIDITPRTHHDDDVSLALKVVVTSQLGNRFGGLPTFGNREITTSIRLRDGETNLLAGLIRDDERMVLEGIPGLSDIPGVGRALRAQPQGNGADRRRADADPAHHPRARSQRRRPAPLPREQRCRLAADRSADYSDAARDRASGTATGSAGRAAGAVARSAAAARAAHPGTLAPAPPAR